MPAIVSSLGMAIGELADGKVLRILLKSIAVTIMVFIAVAWAGWYAFDWLFEWLGLADSLFRGAEGIREAASALFALLGLWLTWRVVAMAVIQFYAEDVVRAVEARHYPQQASAARDLSTDEQVQASLGGILRALIANLVALPVALTLLFTGFGPALVFWGVNAMLVGRELQDMVWLRYRQQKAELAPVSKFERFLLGGAVAGLLALPFVNFLAPVLGAAGATHLVHRKVGNKVEAGHA